MNGMMDGIINDWDGALLLGFDKILRFFFRILNKIHVNNLPEPWHI